MSGLDSSGKRVYENNLLSICFGWSQAGRLQLPLKVGQVAEMNGRFRRRSYVNVYPISDSSEAGGHLMSSAESRPSPHVGSKVQPLPQGISSHSHHMLGPPSRACQEEYRHPKEKRRQKGWKTGFGGGALSGQQGCLDASWLLWLGGLDN